MRTRLGGLVILLIGGAVFYLFLLLPLQRAQAGAAEVHYELKAFALVPLCLVFGLIFLIFGDNFDYRTANHDNLTPRGWAAFVVIATLAALGWWWFGGQFAALGYR